MTKKTSITMESFLRHVDNHDGYCTTCRTFTFGGVEPDAEDYECEECGDNSVMGTEQALLTGDIDICDDEEALEDDSNEQKGEVN